MHYRVRLATFTRAMKSCNETTNSIPEYSLYIRITLAAVEPTNNLSVSALVQPDSARGAGRFRTRISTI
jgi:hypothetical protein